MKQQVFNIGATSRAIATDTVWVSCPSDLEAAKAAYATRHGLPASGVWIELDNFASTLSQSKAA